MMKTRKFSFMGMPIEVREYVPEDSVLIVKPGKANWVKKTDGSEVIQTIKDPEIVELKLTPATKKGQSK